MKRAEVWWAELSAPVGARPVVILTRDAVVDRMTSLAVALVTRTVRGVPTEVILGRTEGLPRRCVANLDNILTVPRSRLKRQMGALSKDQIKELDKAIIHALGVANF